MRKRIIIGVVFVLAAGFFWYTGSIKNVLLRVYYRLPVAVFGLPVCPDCNIIFISIDVLRADDLPCYGYLRDTAPLLCGFAARHTYFSHFYSASSYTMDDHFSVFTGLYPSSHHVLVPYRDGLNPDIPTLSQELQGNGYRTIYLGATEDPNLPLDKGVGRGFDAIYDVGGGSDLRQKLTKLLPAMNGEKPSFLYVHSYLLHAPYLPGSGPRLYVPDTFPAIPLTEDEYYVNTLPFYEMVLVDFKNRLAASNTQGSISRNSAIVRRLSAAIAAGDLSRAQEVFASSLTWAEKGALYEVWYLRSIDKTNPQLIAYFRGLYDEQIHAVDGQLAPLFTYVKNPDVRRKTIVIITSDHGEEFMEHGQIEHDNNIYNTTTYVPFILAAPKIQKGVINALGQTVDIFPTLLRLVGIRKLPPTDGRSLVPLLIGKTTTGDQYVVSQYRGGVITSIQDGRWKLYLNREPQNPAWNELYDLTADPLEQHNVYGRYPAVVAELNRALGAILRRSPKYAPDIFGFPEWIDKVKQEKLINTGYF